MSRDTPAATVPLPMTGDLSRVLARLAETRGAGELLAVVERRPGPQESTFPVEVVRCRFADGTTRELFCKYSAGVSHPAHGHRGDVGYEASVYEQVLDASPVRTVGFFGAYRTAGETWLAIDYLDAAVRASKAADPEVMPAAARWLGRFHAAHAGPGVSGLIEYDEGYYQGWAQRTRRFAAALPEARSWLDGLDFEPVFQTLLSGTQTIVHGEFYSGNVLVKDGLVYPVDWESAAVAPGEIDLAMLTEGWPAVAVSSCEAAYAEARWQGSPPDGFVRTLDCARVYVLLRWLGERPDWTVASSYRFEHLRAVSARLGLVGAP